MSRRKVSERLVDRLRAEGLELPEGTVLLRIHHRSFGAWSWFAAVPSRGVMRGLGIGSEHTMAACLAAKKLSVWELRKGTTYVDIEKEQ